MRNSLVLHTNERFLKYIWNAIPVQINSIHSHGERSGNPYQPAPPSGANDLAMRFGRVQYRTHFRAVIRAKYLACFCSMRAMVVSSGVCSKASYHSFEAVRILPASDGVHQADASLSVSRLVGLSPPRDTNFVSRSDASCRTCVAQERGTPRLPFRSIEPTLCSTVQEG